MRVKQYTLISILFYAYTIIPCLGKYEILWDATDWKGEQIVSGIYFYRIQSGKYIQTGKLIYMK